MTDRSAIGFECKKHHMRQTGEGWVISFVVHPDDIIPHWFSNARISTPMKVAVELVDPDADMQSASAPEKKREPRERKLSERLALACKDWDFWRYLRTLGYDGVEDANDADIAVKMYCLIKSKTECDVPGSNAEFAVQGLLDGYYDWKRTDARYSGTPAYEASR